MITQMDLYGNALDKVPRAPRFSECEYYTLEDIDTIIGNMRLAIERRMHQWG